ncbi:hypothetical protein S83_003990 [Arachis hypogaea]
MVKWVKWVIVLNHSQLLPQPLTISPPPSHLSTASSSSPTRLSKLLFSLPTSSHAPLTPTTSSPCLPLPPPVNHLRCPSSPCPIPLPLHFLAYPNTLYSPSNRTLSLLRTVLSLGFAKECDLILWIIDNSPPYDVVIGSPMQKETVFVMAHMKRWKKESAFFKNAKKLFCTIVLPSMVLGLVFLFIALFPRV